MEFSIDQPSILATLRADYFLFLSQRIGHPRRGWKPDNPLFPFPDRLSSVFSARGEKANS
jgi:hypothetical protein